MAYRIVHYINQFFAGIGGEEKADFSPEVKKGAIGPGVQLQNLLGAEAEIVATFVCGDNYFAVNQQEALERFASLLKEHEPDLVIAGPSFYAGRYGFACGHVLRLARDSFGVPGISGMSVESPAVEMFRRETYIVETGDSARHMKQALPDMARLAQRILRQEPLGEASANGYFHRGRRRNFLVEQNGGVRAVEMLIRKMTGEPFESEYIQEIPEKIEPAPRVENFRQATLALLTTGGMVPAGNPDRIEGSAATKFGVYSFAGQMALRQGEIVSIHGGYDTSLAAENPNRIVPVDILREMEKAGEIGRLHEAFYSTAGTGASLINGEAFGRDIASLLSEAGVDAAIMVST